MPTPAARSGKAKTARGSVRGEAVKAVVVKKPDTEVTAGELITWGRERIAGYKLPKSVDFIEMLPRNPTGRILKRELRKSYWGDRQVN